MAKFKTLTRAHSTIKWKMIEKVTSLKSTICIHSIFKTSASACYYWLGMHCIKSYEVEDIGNKRERNQNMKTKWKDVNSLPGAIYPMVLTTIVRFDESRLRNRAVPKSPTLGSHSELSKTLLADMSLCTIGGVKSWWR